MAECMTNLRAMGRTHLSLDDQRRVFANYVCQFKHFGHRALPEDYPGLQAMLGEMQVTVTLRPVVCGTEGNIEQAGVPAVIPAEMCYFGWQESLAQLAQLVEPDIPN
jgi:hypothetical protein